MKSILIVFFLSLCFSHVAQAQKSIMKGDTLIYLDKYKFYVGAPLFFSTKKGDDKSYNFCFSGKKITELTKLDSGFRLVIIRITKIVKHQGKYFIQGEFIGKDRTLWDITTRKGDLLGVSVKPDASMKKLKAFIDIENAWDNGECWYYSNMRF